MRKEGHGRMMIKPVREERALVLLGNFNPIIFHPAWFASEGLIRKSEAEQAKSELIHPDVAQIDFGGYKLLVTRERFQLTTEQSPYFRVIADLTQGIFQLLQHTPLHAAGYNATEDYRMDNEGHWQALAHLMAPTQQVWADLFDEPELRMLRIQSATPLGHTQVQVSPLEPKPPLTFRIAFTDHFDAPTDSVGRGAKEMLSVFMDNRERSEEKCQQVFSKLVKLATGKP